MPCILLVDDDKEHIKLFTMILGNRGYSLDTYSDPAAALLKFKPNYYDLLLLDYRMPNLNGLELLERGKMDHILSDLASLMLHFKDLRDKNLVEEDILERIVTIYEHLHTAVVNSRIDNNKIGTQ